MTLVDYAPDIDSYRVAEGVSQSQLKHLARSPAHFKYAIENPIEPTPQMEFGSLVDHLFFGTQYKWVESKYDDYRKQEARDWRNAMRDSGVAVFRESEIANAKTLVESIQRREAVQKILGAGNAQVAIYAELEGVQCKGLADWVATNVAVIADLKTTAKPASSVLVPGDDEDAGMASGEEFGRIVVNMGYDVQAAFYADLWHAATGETMDFWWIVAEAFPPYEVAVLASTPEVIARGRRIYRARLAQLRHCMANNSWPGYPDKAQFVQLPAWAK